ncbi:4568_t:CDS:10 [Scutellospora calospora]|uniref:4568_t:CDS:1 n=1 Tax=Scutellospora calospora TaxID=85575 RepID=A0ACA9LSR9_9GLOM|nr:4568_t:CDS:10 [Scutellospora calospora]
MGKRERSTLLPNNIPQLQNLIKRDPLSYKEDFLQQYRHYESQLTILQLKPDEEAEEFGNLVTFISQVAQCYPQETNTFSQQLINLLSEHYQILNPNLRKTMVQSLILLRNKDIIPSITVLSLFYTLFRVRDKQLRDLLYSHIISDIKNNNAKHKNNKLNKTLQNFMYTILQSTTDSTNVIAAKKSLDACIDLYKKGIWNDSKTVNIISEACFHSVTKIKVTAIQFFLESDNENQDEDSEDDYQDIPDIKRLQHINLVNKTKKSKLRKLEKAISIYIKPHQRDVTMVLVVVAQSCHELVPPDVLEPIIKTIANNFVSDHCASEVMTAGLNAIREICMRQPLAIDSTLLQDLAEYKSDRDKGVMMAAKSLIGLFREINPEMLKRKDRGKIASMNMKNFNPLQYGKIRMTEQIEGIELLEEYKKQQMQEGVVGDEDEWAEWEVASNASSNDDWIDVSDEYDENEDNIDDENEDNGGNENEDNGDNENEDNGDNENENDRDDENENEDNEDNKEDGKEETKEDRECDKGCVKEVTEDKKIPSLATTQLLTPADFFKLNELKMKHKVCQLMDGGKRKRGDDRIQNDEPSDIVDINFITGPRKKAKQDYEERIESIKTGREGRGKFGGPKKGKKVEGTSTTNKEKARHKAFMMVVHKKNAISKKRLSLRDKQVICNKFRNDN